MWKLKEYERAMYKIIDIIDESGEVIKTFVADDLDYPEKKRKAQLMAAAPELLETAERTLDTLNSGVISKIDFREWKRDLEKIIKKAKGDD